MREKIQFRWRDYVASAYLRRIMGGSRDFNPGKGGRIYRRYDHYRGGRHPRPSPSQRPVSESRAGCEQAAFDRGQKR